MKFYFAPMEGITTYQYRNLHHKYFGGVDKYFTPFLAPGPSQGLSVKEVKDALPENNRGIPLVPQILTNRAGDFLNAAKILGNFGYREINLNLGCPSGTVTAKKKGSGLLYYPEELNAMLDEVFSDPEVQSGAIEVSIKTRIGKNSVEEWPGLLKIYNQYPLKELIIHPRIQKDFYKNTPNWEIFGEAVKESKNPTAYNGDIFTENDFGKFTETFPEVETVMLGRGLIRNPMLAEQLGSRQAINQADGLPAASITGQTARRTSDRPDDRDPARIRAFHDELLEAYCQSMSGDRNVLFKMKEIWSYLIFSFPGNEKLEKKIRKSTRLSEYRQAVGELF